MSDQLTRALACYALETNPDVVGEAPRHAVRALLDAFGAAMAAVHHPAAVAARRYAFTMPSARGALLWTTPFEVNVEAATLANSVLLRCNDFNDLYFGEKQWGHPGDLVGGVVTVSDALRTDGRQLLQAVIIGYDVTLELCDAISLGSRGWDYVNLVGIGATCAVGRLLGLSVTQLEHALSIAVVPHFASDQVESNELDEEGNLTLWKRFNGADAVRNAVYACSLAKAGARGALRPFMGTMGLFASLGIDDGDDVVARLLSRLVPGQALYRVKDTEFKMWPVGSRGQSAILAALRCREQIDHPWEIERLTVYADPAVINHLVKEDAFAPRSRETADHSLPYIVTVALFDGLVDNDSFSRLRYEDPGLRSFLMSRVKVHADDSLALGSAGGFPVRLEIETTDSKRITERAEKAPGHRDNPLTDGQLTEKVVGNCEPLLGRMEAEAFAEMLWKISELNDVRALTSRLVR